MEAPGASEQRQIVWEVLAQFWVDTWYDDDEFDRFADKVAACGFTLEELDEIVHRDVCGAFALFTLSVFLSFGMALPDWYYPEDEARRTVGEWVQRPRIQSQVNPVWWIGNLAARNFVRPEWNKLRTKVALRAVDRPSQG